MRHTKHITTTALTILSVSILMLTGCVGPQRFRTPAPAEDGGVLMAEPILGPCAGHDDGCKQLHVMEWSAKRTWHVLGLKYQRKDRKGPPEQSIERNADHAIITGTIANGGIPVRNQVITCDIEQRDEPILLHLRSTDAFGEVLIELDLIRGFVQARSVTVSRSMIGGQSHSSPMPEQSSNRIITRKPFDAISGGWHELKMETRGARITLWVDGDKLFAFDDPDPAGGKYGFGTVGTITVRNVQQWELISPAERQRREACLVDMREFSKGLDVEYEGDVRKLNHVATDDDQVVWTWPATGAKAIFVPAMGKVFAKVTAGLYGNDTLIEGVFPEVIVTAADGRIFRPDKTKKTEIDADAFAIRMRIPLADHGGNAAIANVRVQLTVQTVWFWTIDIEGVEVQNSQAILGVAPRFALTSKESDTHREDMAVAIAGVQDKGIHYRHNNKVGVFLKTITNNTTLGVKADGRKETVISANGNKIRFASSWLPAQPLNKTGFGSRMVHYIKYPEGPIEHWRRMPSYQEYPTNIDLARFKGHGCDAMVWHHTWTSNDYRDREGFLVNHKEMKRAADETHRLGMGFIGYIGIVPGRNALLRLDDARDSYAKNWDLQDFTFYSTPGRWQEFFPWMTDYWCREYGLDGYYADGAFGYAAMGRLKKPLHPEDAELSMDELQHRFYYRIRKVLDRHGARFGLEQWGGSHDMLVTGFYDCRMIGESFQEASPQHYRASYNALLTGTPFKMYGMRETSQNPYNIAMAAVCMSDIQVCSGNGAWGDVADTTETWDRVGPFWKLLDSIHWDELVDARPWYAQELVKGTGFFAGNYTEPKRSLIFLANRSEKPGPFDVQIDTSRLPAIDGNWHVRYVYGREGEIGPLGEGKLRIRLPSLRNGPIGIELIVKK